MALFRVEYRRYFHHVSRKYVKTLFQHLICFLFLLTRLAMTLAASTMRARRSSFSSIVKRLPFEPTMPNSRRIASCTIRAPRYSNVATHGLLSLSFCEWIILSKRRGGKLLCFVVAVCLGRMPWLGDGKASRALLSAHYHLSPALPALTRIRFSPCPLSFAGLGRAQRGAGRGRAVRFRRRPRHRVRARRALGGARWQLCALLPLLPGAGARVAAHFYGQTDAARAISRAAEHLRSVRGAFFSIFLFRALFAFQ
jgi:hypothetical protein